MNSALLYRPSGRSIFWVALMSAVAIHLCAVALARTKSTKPENFTPLGAVDIVDASEPEPASPEQSVSPPPLEQIQPDQDVFREENSTPPPVHAHRRTRPPSFVRGMPTTSSHSVKAMVAYAPRPVYPYEARRQRVTGSGVALLTIDQTCGTVTDVRMTQSCGAIILDNSTRDALRKWRSGRGV